MTTTHALTTHLHLHLALLDYVAAFCAGTSILLFPTYCANTLFFPEMSITSITIFTLQLFAFMLIVFASHFAYHIHYSIITPRKIKAILWMLFVGDLLHLYVYYRGCQMEIFKDNVWNAGVLPNVIISSYAGISRLVYLFLIEDNGLKSLKSKTK